MWCRLTMYGPDGTALCETTLAGAGAPDIGVVDQLARMRLRAVRAGATLELAEVSTALAELLELAGLSELLGQVRREAEAREDPAGVEE
jgi:hypothetical protein